MTLEQMKNVDVRTVDPHSLVDQANVQVDESLTLVERMRKYIEDVGNPYCFVDDGVVVKISFANQGESIEDRLRAYIRSHG